MSDKKEDEVRSITLNIDPQLLLDAQKLPGKTTIKKMREECAELIVAVEHYEDGRPGMLEQLRDEIADVLIIALGCRELWRDEVDEHIAFKCKRLKNRIQLYKFRS